MTPYCEELTGSDYKSTIVFSFDISFYIYDINYLRKAILILLMKVFL